MALEHFANTKINKIANLPKAIIMIHEGTRIQDANVWCDGVNRL